MLTYMFAYTELCIPSNSSSYKRPNYVTIMNVYCENIGKNKTVFVGSGLFKHYFDFDF